MKWKKSVQYDEHRGHHVVEDARIFRVKNVTNIIYSVKSTGKNVLYIGEIFLDNITDNLVLNYPTNKVISDDSFHKRNWSPFIYEFQRPGVPQEKVRACHTHPYYAH